MAKASVGRTALGAAVCRLIEQYQSPELRLFQDQVIQDLLGGLINFLMRFATIRQLTVQKTEAVARGLYGLQVCRTRYIDDAVQNALSSGIQQLVILGAGYDTRAYRLPGLEKVRIFEVDLPAVQADKQKKLTKHFNNLPEQVRFIPIDFDKQSLEQALLGGGYKPEQPAIFIWEGVTQYITEAAVDKTLSFISSTASGSVLVFTYVLKSIIDGHSELPEAKQLKQTVDKQSPWIFGFEPAELPKILAQYQLKLVEDVGNQDYQIRYLKPLGRQLAVSEAERIAQVLVV